tara:strand:- start:4650 stop:5585 length:936 start_codon:yes stop_codon:yes gene_type:complete
MEEVKYKNSLYIVDDELDLIAIFGALIKNWRSILVISFFCLGVSLLVSLMMPNKYTSSVLIIAEEGNSMESSLSQYSSLANFAGINVQTETNRGLLGLETLKSRVLVQNFINENNLLVPLFASKKWDIESGDIVLDKKIYDPISKKWTRKASFPKQPKPSLNEAYELWIQDIFSYTYDEQNGFITFSITHHSPFLAAEWATLLIEKLNNYMRERDVVEAELSIEYLNEAVSGTQSEELRELFYKLIQSKTEQKMLAYSKSEYLFTIVDPPVISEEHSYPNRLIICLIGLIIGIFVGSIVAIFRTSKSSISS